MSRSLLLVCLLVVLASVYVAASPPSCETGDRKCQVAVMNGPGTFEATVQFEYLTSGPDAGAICNIGLVGISNANGPIFSFTGTLEPTDGSVATVTNGQANNLILGFTSGTVTFQVGSSSASAITPAGTGAAAHYSYVDTNTNAPLSYTGKVDESTTFSRCGNGGGDPHFTGFLGQQFHLIGQNGSVYNLLSSSSMQLNTRLVQLNEGDAMSRSQMRMFRLKSLFTLPNTEWFGHAGPYMGELGLAMLNGHQLYAQAGGYEHGWNTVLLDDVAFPVSEEAVVLGTGADAVTISRPNAHQIAIETSLVHLTITNSDHFFNVDTAFLKPEFVFEQTPLDGALGQTANAKNGGAKWRQQIEEAVLVESGNLFQLTPSTASAWSR